MQRKEKEGEMAQKEEAIRKHGTELNQVKTNDAFKAILKEIDDKKAADAKAGEVAAASRRLMFEVVLSEDQGKYKFNSVDLPDAVKARIDDLVNQLKADPKGVYFEIEGHTDATGPVEINDKVGLERADAVKRYLYEAHQIPLHKINIISFGEKKPVAPRVLANTAAGGLLGFVFVSMVVVGRSLSRKSRKGRS